ncbi:uncharacterized protein LOC114188414 [Vigna unguiculata]|uniref:uncharacterized protein LOC114188414 n=1 Tax=Vigna unguiculata TaxID=3917 RepID=UPI00101648E0|nr:uncharacterized protein LOC114188414 [Vigna unguiculata]
MQIFLESIDRGIWDAILNGPFVPTITVNNLQEPKPFSQWTAEENRRAQYDVRARNIISFALTLDEFYRISVCTSAQEMWEILRVTHEGTDDVKRARKNSLIQEYEMLRMQQGETICDVQKRFTHIVNHLSGLGKNFDIDELNIKILKSLNRTWQPKVTTITESQNLTIMSMAALFGKLREHELELGRLNEEEDQGRKRNIAFKSEIIKSKIPKEDNDSDDENMSLMIKKFTKFMKSNGKGHHKRYKNENQNFVSKFNCYGCGETGHVKMDCPNAKKGKEKNGKKVFKKKKSEDNDSSSSSSSSSSNESDEEANLCLIAEHDSSDSEVSSCSNDNDYDSLYDAFQQLLHKSSKLDAAHKKLKYDFKELQKAKDRSNLMVVILATEGSQSRFRSAQELSVPLPQPFANFHVVKQLHMILVLRESQWSKQPT